MRFNHFLWKSKFPDLSTVFFFIFPHFFQPTSSSSSSSHLSLCVVSLSICAIKTHRHKKRGEGKKETFSSHLLSFVSFFLCCYLGGVLMKPIYSVKLCAFEQISIKKSKGFINKKKRMKKRRTEVKISINVTHPSCLAFVLLSV